jgi:hypothetical protein
MPARSPSRPKTLSSSRAAGAYGGSVMTLRTDVCRSTPAVVAFRSGSAVAAPLISRLSLAPLLPRYSVSCRLVEYSLRRGLLPKFFHENSDGSLSVSGFEAAVFRNGRRNLAVARYVITSMKKTATAMMAICAAC